MYIYNFVEPSSFVCKLLPQRVCDGHETRPYYRALHGECHKAIGRKRFVVPEKSAVQILNLMKIDAMFLCVNGGRMRDSGHVVVCTCVKRQLNA